MDKIGVLLGMTLDFKLTENIVKIKDRAFQKYY